MLYLTFVKQEYVIGDWVSEYYVLTRIECDDKDKFACKYKEELKETSKGHTTEDELIASVYYDLILSNTTDKPEFYTWLSNTDTTTSDMSDRLVQEGIVLNITVCEIKG